MKINLTALDNIKIRLHHHKMNKDFFPLWENPGVQEINRLPMRSPLLPFASAEDALIDAIAGPEYRAFLCSSQNNPFFMSLDTQDDDKMSGGISGRKSGVSSYSGLPENAWKFKLINNPYEDLQPEHAQYAAQSPAQSESKKSHNASNSAESALYNWINPEFNADDWYNIIVPGTWSRQKPNSLFENCFDKPHYTNVQMPFQAEPPRAGFAADAEAPACTPAENPTGLYRRTFTLPHFWNDRRVVLHIGSAESVAFVYVNGFFAGAGKDTRLPHEYDITPFIHEGENLLCIKVVRYSDASYVEDQDQWWLGGIHRSVYLYSTSGCYVKDIKVLPGAIYGGEKKQGKLNLSVTLAGSLPESRSTGNGAIETTRDGNPFVIKYSLYPFILPSDTQDAEKIAEKLVQDGPLLDGSMEFFADYRLNSNTTEAELILDEPKAWSHEEPSLYVLLAELSRGGHSLESFAFCTGFRNIRIEKRKLLINEKAVYIKGVNRHEHDEKTGKTLSAESMLRDIKILKSHNFNAVRTSHYPDDERWYELCDRYGIYLWDEANIESHCFQNQLCNDTYWTHAFVSRIHRMAERDKNHVSVIVWSLGNESGCGVNHDAGAAWIRRYDPSRPVNYEGAMRGRGNTLDNWRKGKSVTDIVCPMYPEIENIVDFVKKRDDQRPLIMCEYSHAMGNSNGSLADYWKAIESNPGLQGGFIWEWIDQGFEAFTEDGVKYWKYGGDFGDDPSDLDFICDGLLFPDQTPKPAMEECKQIFSPVRLTPVAGKPLTFIIENRYDFTSLDNIVMRYKIFQDNPDIKTEHRAAGSQTEDPGVSSFDATTEKILKKEIISLPCLNPGEKKEIQIGDESDLFFRSLKGSIIFHADFILKEDTPWAEKGHVTGQAQRILKEDLQITFIDSSKSLTKSELSFNLPYIIKPSVFRVPTQNDGLKTYMKLRGDPSFSFYFKNKAMYPWLDLDLINLRIGNEEIEKIAYNGIPARHYSATLLAGENAVPEYSHYAKEPGLGTFSYYLSNASGQPSVLEVFFDLDTSLPELPRIGITAEIPATYNEISWFGAGPHESYPDRMDSAFLGRYKHSIADLEVPYIVPQENGNRSGVRNFTLINEDNSKNITFIAENPVNISCSRYSQENMWKALHTCDLIDLAKTSDGRWFLYIDIAQRGVGTATCGPDTRDEYRIRGGLYKMKLNIY